MKSTLLAVAMVALMLAACTPGLDKPGIAVTDPKFTDDAFVAADGARLPLRRWLPEGEPNAVVLALHGFNDYSRAFEGPGKYLAARGIAVYAYDQRGFGQAPDPGSWAGTDALVGDLDAAAALLAARYPGKPLFLLGESMGGAVTMVAMSRPDAPHVAGIILEAPAVWSRPTMNVFMRVGLWLTAHTVPWLPVNGNGLDIWPSDNIPMLRALSRDPLVIKDTRIGTIDGLVNLMDQAYGAAPKLRVPTLMLYGEHDQIVPPEPSYQVMEKLQGDPLHAVCAVYPKGYHMLLRDLEADTVLADIVSWIADPHAPLPSGADRRSHEVLAARKDKLAG